ncbi:NAD kinase [Oxalobacter vibrioformis]|uniref:NAD kinase n=1 Tax=Oxalobacter vibrioformis TaxID=933080 RepID=A0A9E9P3K9_9BURK|nr:NAD kinase [Oxalobacter vibrioformis]NLC24940.1 NAD kinase [Oxalobacter sp.]WAW09241.1 NAD kinase [Oxalobacter vibrioformis]
MSEKKKIFALVSRSYTESILDSMKKIADFLEQAGYIVVYESQTAMNIPFDNVTPMNIEDIGTRAAAAIVIGGDGTMLGIARQLSPYTVPLMGINHGRLGFMTDIPLEQMLPVLEQMLQGKYVSETRFLIEGAIIREGEAIYQATAFNDIVICRGGGSGMIDLKVEVDGHFMYQQRSDGLIMSTPTGSTAYSLSAGGPMMHPNLGGIAIVSIAPHSLSNRPIIVPDTSEIVIELIEANQPSVNYDSQSFASLRLGDRIVVKRSSNTITFLHPQGWSYYDTLRNKLYWGETAVREKK